VGIVTLLIAVITEAYSNRYQRVVTRRGKTRKAGLLKADINKKNSESLTREEVERLPYAVSSDPRVSRA
jgi:hypothetical protein